MDEPLKAALIDMKRAALSGTSLRLALEAHSDVFLRDFTEGFRCGEETGAVDVFLKQYAEENWNP